MQYSNSFGRSSRCSGLTTHRGPLERLSKSRVSRWDDKPRLLYLHLSLQSRVRSRQPQGTATSFACNVLSPSTNARLIAHPKQAKVSGASGQPLHPPQVHRRIRLSSANTTNRSSASLTHRSACIPPQATAIMDAPEPETPFAAVSAQTTKFQRVSRS